MKPFTLRTLRSTIDSLPLALGAALLAQSATVAYAARPSDRDTPRAETRRETSTNAKSTSALAKLAPAGEDYVLQTQDVIRLHIFQHDDINKQTEAVSISKDYTVTLPLIGSLNLRGKTVRQAEEMIRAAYDKDYLVSPQVSVLVTTYAERTVNVIGQVNQAGRVKFPPQQGLTIVEAISAAGGQNRLADLKHVKLTRRNADGEPITEEINVDAMMKGGGGDNIQLQKDDVIFVPERII